LAAQIVKRLVPAVGRKALRVCRRVRHKGGKERKSKETAEFHDGQSVAQIASAYMWRSL